MAKKQVTHPHGHYRGQLSDEGQLRMQQEESLKVRKHATHRVLWSKGRVEIVTLPLDRNM